MGSLASRGDSRIVVDHTRTLAKNPPTLTATAGDRQRLPVINGSVARMLNQSTEPTRLCSSFRSEEQASDAGAAAVSDVVRSGTAPLARRHARFGARLSRKGGAGRGGRLGLVPGRCRVERFRPGERPGAVSRPAGGCLVGVELGEVVRHHY